MKKIRVLVVDDHDLVRTGFVGQINAAPDMEVVGEAKDGHEAIDMVRKHRPDVVLMDVNMPGLSGLDAAGTIRKRFKKVAIVVVTVHDQGEFPKRLLLEIGAEGYLTKKSSPEELGSAVRAAAAGRRYITPEVAQRMALSPDKSSSPFKTLSNRETEVMMLLCQGLDTQEIAQSMSLAVNTVSTYRYRIHDKAGVRNDVELTRLAITHGLLD